METTIWGLEKIGFGTLSTSKFLVNALSEQVLTASPSWITKAILSEEVLHVLRGCMVVSIIVGPQYGPPTIILMLGTPRRYPTFLETPI